MTPVGVIVVDKPSGITSHDVVARTRKALQTRKVGHGGTLDPMATGVATRKVATAVLSPRVARQRTSHQKGSSSSLAKATACRRWLRNFAFGRLLLHSPT